jgi:hypothetical protein
MWSMKMVVKYFLSWHLGFEDEVNDEKTTDKQHVLHYNNTDQKIYGLLSH